MALYNGVTASSVGINRLTISTKSLFRHINRLYDANEKLEGE